MYKIIAKFYNEDKKETIEKTFNRIKKEHAENDFYDISVYYETVEVFLYDADFNLLNKKLGHAGKKLLGLIKQ